MFAKNVLSRGMRISVIIPVFNAVDFVEHSVFSVLCQPEVKEILLIEDGSTDGSAKVCERLASQYDIIRLLRHPNSENRGPGASRNLGIRKATQEFIAFLDADDYYVPNRFAYAAEVFRKFVDADGVYEPMGITYSSDAVKLEYFNWGNPILKSRVFELNAGPDELFEKMISLERVFINLNVLVIKNTANVSSVLFDEDLMMTQDTDYIWRLCESVRLYPGSSCHAVAIRRLHAGNRIHQHDKVKMYRYFIFRKWFHLIRVKKWPAHVNRGIIRRFVYIHFVKYFGTSKLDKIIKGIIALYLLVRYPWVIRKIIS